ncbi:MAG: DUF1636 domain-containing protein [Pseudomonadota bacterium]
MPSQFDATSALVNSAAGDAAPGNAAQDDAALDDAAIGGATKTTAASVADTEILVCATCRPNGAAIDTRRRPGEELIDALRAALPESGLGETVRLRSVRCLGVCNRPCTVAVSAADKFTYVVGDLAVETDVDGLLAFVAQYRAAGDGVTGWFERPECVRDHTIARVPNLGMVSDTVSDA